MGRVLEGAERDESLKHFGDNILAIESEPTALPTITELQDENAKLRETLEAISAHEDDLHKCGIGYDNYVDRKVKQALKGESDGN